MQSRAFKLDKLLYCHLNRLRLTSLPDFPEFNRKTVPGSEDVGRILAIRSVVHEIILR